MMSAFKPLGDFLHLVDERNREEISDRVLGINIDKYFMPSVANIIGTDLSNYKVLRKGRFACNPMHVGRDGRLPVSLYMEDEPALVSPAYFLFELNEGSNIDIEYLMLCFRRPAFDRYCTFKTDSSVRGGITWDDICSIELPVPSIEEQQKIVHIYNVINNRIELLGQLNSNLANQADAIFKKYFINIDKIPDNWTTGNLTDIADYLNGLAMQKFRPKDNEIGLPVLKIKELRQGLCDSSSELCSPNIKEEYIIDDGEVIFSWSGSLLVDFWCGGKCGLNQHLFKVTSSKYDSWFYYCWTLYHLNSFIVIAAGKATTMGHIKRENLDEAKVLIPDEDDYNKFGAVLQPIYDQIILNKVENRKLSVLRDTLLPKLMSGELDVSNIDI